MKLSDHVDKIRNLISAAYDKQFARLGIGANKQIELEKLPEQVRAKRKHLEVMLENHIGEKGCYQDAREKLLDELSFTLFNRLAAVKVMESANLFPPVITKQAEHGGRSFGHKAWLEEYPENRENELEGIRDYFKHAFNELGESLSLYSKEYPYALLPDAISLNEIIEAFNVIAEDSQIEDDIWQSDDVLGWLYESYNNAKKLAFKDSKAKTEYDKVSLQSQVYTPRWVVQFLVENSLGKLYLEMYPESDIKNQFKIANAPKTQERDLKPLHEIKLIDPASGSGNFLLYAFDFFYALYIDQIENYDADYDEDEIPKLIIENNLHGIDLDDRAIQLAQLGLYIKARKKRRFIKGSFNFKVVSSDFYLPEYDEARYIFEDGGHLDNTQKELIEDIWNDLRYAYKFGSLIRLDEKLKAKLKELEAKQGDKVLDLFADADIREQKDFTETFFNNLKAAVEKFAGTDADTFIASKTRDAITFLELLTTEYDVACANPPYTDSSDFGSELKQFIDRNYKKPIKFHANLYSAFIKRCYEFTSLDGKIAMIHPRTFMFIKTFEDVRKFIVEKTSINVFVDYSLSNLFGSIMVDPAFYVLEKGYVEDKKAWFISLDQYTRTPNEKFKKEYCLGALGDHIVNLENKHNHYIFQSKLKMIKSFPFIYWISDDFREKFKSGVLDSYVAVCSGLATCNNNMFLRYWWEIAQSPKDPLNLNDKWFFYSKGGPYNKWYGNLWCTVNWEAEGLDIHNYNNIPLDYNGAPVRNKKFYFKEGVTYSASGTKGASFRYLPKNHIFDVGGASIFLTKSFKNNSYLLALLNSKLSFYIVSCLNPTVNTQVGDLRRIPFIVPNKNTEELVTKLTNENIEIKRELSKYSLLEFESENFIGFSLGSIFNYLNKENFLHTVIILNEAIVNEQIFEVYDLSKFDREMVLEKQGVNIGNLPITEKAKIYFLEKYNRNKKYYSIDVFEYVESLQTIDFSVEFEHDLEKKLESLYQNNNDLEEFCIKQQINPINVIYWFENKKIKPKQRVKKIAFEYLLNIIRTVLDLDEDGIVPIVPNAGEKILIDRIEDKFIQSGLTQAQFSSFENLLGRALPDYLHHLFFADLTEHLNMFMYLPKTPFIWHLTSGPEQGFDCYISIYKWNRDNLMRIRSVYIEHRERALMNRQSDLANNESVDAQNEKDKIFKQLKEIEVFKVKIDELLEEGYDPILDDGVGKNIAPLQKKKMLAYDVLNAGQLKKYLNADW